MNSENTFKSVVNILESCFKEEELYFKMYFTNCDGFLIDSDYNIYKLSNFILTDLENNKIEKHNIKFTACLFVSYDKKCIMTIGTLEEYRKKGYAYELISSLIFYLKTCSDMNSIFLHVRVSNPALKLYTKLGFRKVDYLENYYSYTNHNEDAYYMELSLK